MSNSVTEHADAEMATAHQEPAPTSIDKGKGKAVAHEEPVDMEEDEEEGEGEEEEHDDEDADDMDEDELADLQEAVEPEERVIPGSRRSGKKIDYSSVQAHEAAGLQPEQDGEDEEEEFQVNPNHA